MFPDEGKQNERPVAADLIDQFFIYSTDVSDVFRWPPQFQGDLAIHLEV